MRTKPPAARLDFLRSVKLFSGLNKAELTSVDRVVDDIKVEAGHVLTTEGGPGRQAFIIVLGEAEVTIGGRRISTLGPGDVVGEMSLVDGSPRSATVVAGTAMRLLVLDPAGYHSLLQEAAVARKILGEVVRRLRDADAIAAP